MGYWSLYFLIKLALHASGALFFHAWPNALLAIWLTVPMPRMRRVQQLIAIPVAIALLYYDSWLAPPQQLLAQAAELRHFSADYLAELVGRVLSWQLIVLLLAACALPVILRRWIRMEPWVFTGIAAVAITPYLQTTAHKAPRAVAGSHASAETPAQTLQNFYAKEETRHLPAATTTTAPVDLIVLHICSLSWDDLALTGQENHPLLQRFQWLFTQFNSAASYSGPAAIRLLRGNCGQQAHHTLYLPTSPECLVFPSLQAAGYRPQALLNHDGKFGDFRGVLGSNGLLTRPDLIAGAKVTMHQFDGSPVYDDYAVLSQWWKKQLDSHAPAAALYYNTVSLHDGNRFVDSPDLASGKTYATRVARLLDGLQRFIDETHTAGRRAIIVFIPEHGSGMRGDARQIAGMREIPMPAITQVPVGVVLAGHPLQAPIQIDQPMSYLGLMTLLQNLRVGDPYSTTDMKTYSNNLPSTPSVAENDSLVVMQHAQQLWFRDGADAWEPLHAAH